MELNEHYRKDKKQFVAQGFKYGQTFDEIEKEVENYKEKKVNKEYKQMTLFDFMENDNEKQGD